MRNRPAFGSLLRLFNRSTYSQRSGLGLFRLCLILGVASITCAGSIGSSLQQGLTENSRELLGGDVEFTREQYKIANIVQAYAIFSGKLSEVAEVRTMLNAGGKRLMIELKSIDAHYPLYGKLTFKRGKPRSKIFPRSRLNGQFGAAVEQRLLDTLGLKIGDVINIGFTDFEIRGVIDHEPDRLGGGIFGLGPRVMISKTAFDKTGLSDPTRNVRYRYRIKLPAATDLGEWYKTVQQKFPWAKWNTRDWRDPLPGIGPIVERISVFLHFAALTLLITSGIGIASATHSFIIRQQRNLAIHRALGASEKLIRRLVATHLAYVTSQAVVIGLLLGIAIKALLISWLNEHFPLQISTATSGRLLGIAAGYGYAIAAFFVVFPLYAASNVRSSLILRGSVSTLPTPSNWQPYAVAALAIAVLFGLTYQMTYDLKLTLYYGLGLIAGVITLRISMAIIRITCDMSLHHRKLPVWLRLSLMSLRRPAATNSFIAIGLALSFSVVLLICGHSVLLYLQENWPKNAPAYLVHDIPADEVKNLRDQFSQLKGVEEIRTMPLLTGRISEVRTDKVEKLDLPMEHRWAINAPISISYSYGEVISTTLKEGYWWGSDYTGEPLASISEELAEALNLKIGDHFAIQVHNLTLEMEINNIRRTTLGNLGMNFDVIATPTGLPTLNHQWVASIYAHPSADNAIHRLVNYFFSSQTFTDIRDLTARLSQLISQMQTTVWLSAIVTLLASLLVTVSAVSADMTQRLYEAVLLKTLGAGRKILHDIRRMEFGILGVICTLTALIIGSALASAILKKLVPDAFIFPWVMVPLMLFTATGILIITGLLITRRVQSARPLAMLRNE